MTPFNIITENNGAFLNEFSITTAIYLVRITYKSIIGIVILNWFMSIRYLIINITSITTY